MADKKKNIMDLPPGRHEIKIKSLRMLLKKGGAAQIRFVFESKEEDVEGTFMWDTPFFTF